MTILFAGLAACASSQMRQLEKKAELKIIYVEAEFPLSIDPTKDVVSEALKDGLWSLILVKKESQIFPTDQSLVQNANGNEALERYLKVDSSLRNDDYYLFNASDIWWESEYFYNGNPAKFNANFIIHIEPNQNTSTKVEVIEYVSQVWIGKIFLFSGNHGPGMYRDIRLVGPTTKDRVELLDLIKKTAIEKYPGIAFEQ